MALCQKTITFTQKEISGLKKGRVVYKMIDKVWHRLSLKNGDARTIAQLRKAKAKVRMLESKLKGGQNHGK